MSCNTLNSMLETVELKDIFEKNWSHKRIPLMGAIELTYKCNLSCLHCYAECGRSYSDMSLKDIKKIIDQLVLAGNLFLSLTGGEPLLRKDFDDIYIYAKKKGLMVEVLTNGTLITDDKIELFTEFPVLKLDISMYGMTEETYEKVTGKKGSYKRFMSVIEKLKLNNIPFDLKTIVLNENKHEIFDMQQFSEDLGVRFRYSYNISPMINGDKKTCQHRLKPEEAIQFDLMDEGRKQFWLNMNSKHNYTPKKLSENREYPVYFCKAAKHIFHIDANGKLYACGRERCHGYDLLSGTFNEGWNVFLVSEIRNKVASKEYPCITCEYYRLCDHCPADFELENGNPEKPSSFRCQIAKMRSEAFNKLL